MYQLLYQLTCSEQSCAKAFFRMEVWCSAACNSGFLAVYKLLRVKYVDVGAMVTVFLEEHLSWTESLASWPCVSLALSPAVSVNRLT